MSRPGGLAVLSLPVVLAASALVASGGPVTDDAALKLLRAADAPRRVIDEGILRIRATVTAPDTVPVVSELEVYVRGEDQSLCVFRQGPLAGRRVLSVADRTWLIVPGSTRPIPVSASQRLFGGASIADLARVQFAAEYGAVVRPAEELVDGVDCKVLDLEAAHRKVQYPRATLWIGASDSLPRKALFLLRSGKPAKEIEYLSYDRYDGRAMLRSLRIIHLLPSERGMVTTLEFTGHERRRLEDAWFDPDTARDLP